MKNYLVVAVSVLGFLISSASGALLAQEEEEVKYSWGTVNSVSSNQIIVAEYVYSSDEEVDVTYTIDPKVELKNINSLKDIAVGDSVDIDYVITKGKRVAKVITVEKASVEEEYTPREEYYPEEEEETEYYPEGEEEIEY